MRYSSSLRAIYLLTTWAVCIYPLLHVSLTLAQDKTPAQTQLPDMSLPGTPFASITKMRCEGGSTHNHMIYLLDTSGSMRDGNKIGKEKEAVKRALQELRPTDKFNVINFDEIIHVFSPNILPATPDNVLKASTFIDDMKLANYTNVSAPLEEALKEKTLTHVFFLSDGEPNKGVQNFAQLRKFVKEKNLHKVRINTIALGLGERFPGMQLMRTLAEDNKGQYGYINLSNDTNMPDLPDVK
jgi:Ca-activated chloride channel family protein